MFQTLGIVELGSSLDKGHRARYLSYLATRRFGDQSLLEWVVRRVTEAQELDHVVVVTGASETDHNVASLVPSDVLVYHSDKPDPLARLASAVEQYGAEAVVRVRVNSPFVDPVLIDRLARVARENSESDYISFCLNDGQPAILARLGVFAEWSRAQSLALADRHARDLADRAEATRYLYTHPEKFRVRLIPVPSALDRKDVRLTIGGQEDWEHAEQIFEALGPERLDWQRIASLLDEHPALRQRMAVLNKDQAPV